MHPLLRVLPLVVVFALSSCAIMERRAPDQHRSISQTERVTLGGVPQAIRMAELIPER
jgi:hypothetical protein